MSRTHALTGAGSGIGRAIAEILRDRGDQLILLVRDAERIDQLRTEFARAEFVEADLASPGSLHGIGRAVGRTVDSLVHAAGIVDLSPAAQQRLDPWQEQLDVNLTSPAMLTREFLPHLRASRGTLVFVNSTAGLAANATWGAYAASKFGQRAFADAVRAEERDVRVTTVFPSRTATPMQARVHAQEGRDYAEDDWMTPQTVARSVVQVLDLPADATITDVTIRTS